MKVLEESEGEGFRNQHIQFESEPGIEIDARLYVPSSPGRKPAVLLLAGKLSDLLAEKDREDRKSGSDARTSPFSVV